MHMDMEPGPTDEDHVATATAVETPPGAQKNENSARVSARHGEPPSLDAGARGFDA